MRKCIKEIAWSKDKSKLYENSYRERKTIS